MKILSYRFQVAPHWLVAALDGEFDCPEMRCGGPKEPFYRREVASYAGLFYDHASLAVSGFMTAPTDQTDLLDLGKTLES